MFYGNTVQDTRQFFFTSWEKYKNNEPLLALEKQIATVILDHPEYHALLEKPSKLSQDFFPDSGLNNPFLHMGLHLAVRDQIEMDRPQGIKGVFQRLLAKPMEPLEVEHLFMEQLGECLWRAQKEQKAPDENAYLQACLNLKR